MRVRISAQLRVSASKMLFPVNTTQTIRPTLQESQRTWTASLHPEHGAVGGREERGLGVGVEAQAGREVKVDGGYVDYSPAYPAADFIGDRLFARVRVVERVSR